MKTKILCLVLAFTTLITLTACKPNQTMPPQSEETQNTTPSHNVTTPSVNVTTPSVNATAPSDNVTTPSVNATTPSDNVTPPPDNVQDTIITDEFIATCNQNSGGYINYLNGKYYYRNTEGDKLFMCDADGKNAVCLDNCPGATLLGITVDETAVYYLKRTKLDTPLVFNNSSVTYSVVFEGQLRRFCDGNVMVLSEENVLSYALSKDYIFYSTADLKVYRMKHDGTEKTAIVELSNPMTMLVSGNKLYAYRDEEVISTDFDGKNTFTHRLHLYAGAFDESDLYYINLNNIRLCKTQLSETDISAGIHNTKAVTDEMIQSFTVYNGRLVYERLYENDIVIADMDGKNPKVLCPGAAPIALNGHLFYLDDNGAIKVADI